jgi:hypothetical protein
MFFYKHTLTYLTTSTGIINSLILLKIFMKLFHPLNTLAGFDLTTLIAVCT